MVNTSLMQARNYLKGSGRLGSLRGAGANLVGPAGNDVIMAEPWSANNIYNQFTTKTAVDEIINMNA